MSKHFLPFSFTVVTKESKRVHLTTKCDSIKHHKNFVTYELCKNCLKNETRKIVSKED